MKRLAFIFSFIFLCGQLFSQSFDNYFIDKTLRIDYAHIGSFDSDNIEVRAFHAGGIWSGTRAFLVDPNRYGDILFEAFDSTTNQIIYSRSYSSLFNEYRTTERGREEVASFEESVTMPFPKNTIRYIFTAYDRKNVGVVVGSGYFNPAVTPFADFVKEYKMVDLHIGGKPENCMDILLIPDGYSQSDGKLMMRDLKRFASYIKNCRPYKDRLKEVNIRGLKSFSEESGITDPNRDFHVNTLLNCSYNVLEIDRYLMCLNVWKLNAVADDAPYDVLIIITNSEKYGGGGIYNFYATVNNGSNLADYVVVHEMGHLIGGLGDEYYTSYTSVMDYYPDGVEPVEPNLTTLVDFDSKWKDMLPSDTPVPTPATEENKEKLGVYEGGGYVAEGVYRPWMNCTMKECVYDHFCPVCMRVLNRVLDYYSNKKSDSSDKK